MAKKIAEYDSEDGSVHMTVTVPEAVEALAPAPTVDLLSVANLTDGTHQIPLALIAFGGNPRELFEQDALDSLAASMLAIGQEQPISVYRMDEPDADGKLFALITGERRCRSALIAGWTTIRAEIKPRGEESEIYVRRVIENVQREDLTPMEKAKAYYKVYDYYGKDAKAACVALGLRRKTDSGDEGVRVFSQTMQFVTHLTPPVMAMLQKGPKDGGISAAHAALLCRVDSKFQKEMLDACFEPRTVFNGANHEPIPTLISEKELRGKISARFPKEAEAQGKLFDGAVNGVAKDKNDLDREHQQKLESEATEILEGENEPGVLAAGPLPTRSTCQVCGADATHRTSENTPVCNACDPERAAAPVEATKAKDDEVAVTPSQESNDYEKLSTERLNRVGKVFDRIDKLEDLDMERLAMIARAIAPPMPNYVALARMFGPSLEPIYPNYPDGAPASGVAVMTEPNLPRRQWANCNIRSLINLMHERQYRHALLRLVYVLLYLPAVNPNYSDADIVSLEQVFPELPAKKPTPQRAGRDANKNASRGTTGAAAAPAKAKPAKKSDKISGTQIVADVKAAAKKSKIKPTPKKKAPKR